MMPLTLISMFFGIFANLNKNNLSHLIPQENLNKYFKLSNNRQNVIYLYFDRTQGVTWNLLLQIDKLLNKEQSFIDLFPEFCSYTNVISNASLTKISTPALYSGPLFNIAIKQSNFKNLAIQPVNNNELTENQWILYSLYNFANMLKNNNVKNITYNNLPYYADSSMSNYFGNMYKLQKDLKSIGINVNTMSNAKIANDLLYSWIKQLEPESIYDAQTLNALPRLIKFDQTNTGTFFSFFSQQTHENYIIKNNKKYVQTLSKEAFIDSIWTVIQDLKPFLLRLKNEPFVDKNNQQLFDKKGKPISVYDKTMIYILSDHGYDVLKLNSFKKICNYLRQKNILSNSNYDKIFKFNYHQYIPMLNIKKAKYDVNNNIINNKKTFSFNCDQVLSLSDVPVIIENNLHEYFNNKDNLDSYFVSDKIINSFVEDKFRNLIKQQSLINPLDHQVNSLTNKKQINRTFSITSTYDWRMKFYSKTFEIIYEYQWLTKNDFWNNNNFSKIK